MFRYHRSRLAQGEHSYGSIILAQFLKAGYVFEGNLFPTDPARRKARIISPLLANMTLDGIEVCWRKIPQDESPLHPLRR